MTDWIVRENDEGHFDFYDPLEDGEPVATMHKATLLPQEFINFLAVELGFDIAKEYEWSPETDPGVNA